MINEILATTILRLFRLSAREDGAVGMLVVGILIGIALVIFGIIKFLIPGE